MSNSEKKFVPVMITPFNLKAKVDYDAVSKLIDFYLAAGVKGFFANCLSSEMYSISEDERLELTQYIVKYVKGRVPVVATGSFGLTIEDKATFTKRIYNTGVNAVILITGHYANVEDSDQVLLARFNKMLRLTGNIPLGLYECPAPYKRTLSAEVFKKLVETERFVYHKDTTRDVEEVRAKLQVIPSDNTRFEFYDAHTPNGIYSVRLGAKGLSAIAGNFYPEILVWLCNNANNESLKEEVEWLQSEITAVDPLIHEAYPLCAKYFLRKRGLPVRTISRAHALELTPAQKETLDGIYEKFLGWCARLDIQPVNVEEMMMSPVQLDPPI